MKSNDLELISLNKQSIIRKNLNTIKRISHGSKPLMPVLNFNKLGKHEANKEDEGNKTLDRIVIPKILDSEQKETINVVNDKHSIIDGTALTQKIEHNGDNVILSIRYPQLRVFTSNEKQGIKPITTFVIDEENLEGILIKNRKISNARDSINNCKTLHNEDKLSSDKQKTCSHSSSAISFLISQFNTDCKEFCFSKGCLSREQWEEVFTETIYNEEVCIFREDGVEYLLVIKKPIIEYKNLSKNYTLNVFPVSRTNAEELSPEDITYHEILDWIYEESDGWDSRAIEYIEEFNKLDSINIKADKSTKKRVFILNKYEDLRQFTNENDRYREFPCNNHCFYARFSKEDIRRVKSLHIKLDFKTTGISREFVYTFAEFLEFYNQDKGLCEDALVESIKDFYSDPGNLSSYFRILTIDTSVCSRNSAPKELAVRIKIGNAKATITFPHIEDSQFEANGRYTSIMVQDYLKLFGFICGNQSHILTQLEEYIPKIDWKDKLGQIYKP